MKIHLISYGNEKYRSQKEFFKETALASSFFDEIDIYGPEILDFQFQMQFQTILNQEKGGGYWIWKPYLIKRALNNLSDDDILIYCDAGCMINVNGKKQMDEYISLLLSSDKGSIAFELPHKEIEYTKQEVFNHFECPENIVNSFQLMATVILLKKCDHAMGLVDKWYNTLLANPLLFTDDRNLSLQNKRFLQHRHDQSIFSIVRKTYGSEIIADDTYFLDFIREGRDSPIWAARLR